MSAYVIVHATIKDPEKVKGGEVRRGAKMPVCPRCYNWPPKGFVTQKPKFPD